MSGRSPSAARMTGIISASSISPEDAAEMADLRAFTRELMADAERDLGTKLDWVAVDHWNTDNPHIHVLVRGRADDGQDLVISRDYISRGFRDRAAERVTLGARAAQRAGDPHRRWRRRSRRNAGPASIGALRDIADEGGGIVDLRPGVAGRGSGAAPADARPRGEARTARPRRTGRPGLLDTEAGPRADAARALGIRGDIIKTMHRAMSGAGREPDVSRLRPAWR